jgi:predicted dehydrogenase
MAIKYGVIGTNWITDSWITAAEKTGQWQLTAVYSRTLQQAEKFASKHAHLTTTTTLYTDLDQLARDPTLDAIYIASPNSLHHAQAAQMLRARKHVIVEKPATATPAELDDLFRLAREHGVYVIEAYRHLQEANYGRLREVVGTLGTIYGASLTYASYSSRYDDVLAGTTPNIFARDFAGGSLVDIGVYPVAVAVGLFGRPRAQTYVPVICRTGVDGGGVAILHYDGFGVQINSSKCYRSAAPSEIYGENGTVTVNATTDITSVTRWDPKSKTSEECAGPYKTVEKPHVNMEEEAAEFARILLHKDEGARAELERISRDVIHVTSEMRRQAGILYPADEK